MKFSEGPLCLGKRQVPIEIPGVASGRPRREKKNFHRTSARSIQQVRKQTDLSARAVGVPGHHFHSVLGSIDLGKGQILIAMKKLVAEAVPLSAQLDGLVIHPGKVET